MAGHRFDPSILRQYDIRGRWGHSLGPRDAWALGRSFAEVVRRAGGDCVAVGRDGRLSSPELEQALVLGLAEGGVDVRRIGLAPTPVLYYAVASAPEVHGGIEVTGSHNPKDHNGFKMDLGGQPFFGDDIGELGRIAFAGQWTRPPRVGRIETIDLTQAYTARIVKALDGVDLARIEPWRIGWDAGNGAAGPWIEHLVRRLPGRHILFHTRADGHFPNHHPDPSVPENLRDLVAAVAAGKIDFGFAFDGDGDRLALVDRRGRVQWGDRLLLILAQDLLARRPGARIMADVKSSQLVFDGVAALGGEALIAPTGHSLIKSGMKQTGAVLAGELTGHLFFADEFHGVDDALYAALRLLAAAARAGTTLTALADAIPPMHATPDLRLATGGLDPAEVLRSVIAGLTTPFDTTDGARVTTPDGWWLLRASNTETLLTARAESASEAGLARLLADLRARLSDAGIMLSQGIGHG